jgi:hypothetical protein
MEHMHQKPITVLEHIILEQQEMIHQLERIERIDKKYDKQFAEIFALLKKIKIKRSAKCNT